MVKIFLIAHFLVIWPRYRLFRDLGSVCNDRLEFHHRAILRELLPVIDIGTVPEQLRLQMGPITRYQNRLKSASTGSEVCSYLKIL